MHLFYLTLIFRRTSDLKRKTLTIICDLHSNQREFQPFKCASSTISVITTINLAKIVFVVQLKIVKTLIKSPVEPFKDT